jgi:hypothetical protein
VEKNIRYGVKFLGKILVMGSVLTAGLTYGLMKLDNLSSNYDINMSKRDEPIKTRKNFNLSLEQQIGICENYFSSDEIDNTTFTCYNALRNRMLANGDDFGLKKVNDSIKKVGLAEMKVCRDIRTNNSVHSYEQSRFCYDNLDQFARSLGADSVVLSLRKLTEELK